MEAAVNGNITEDEAWYSDKLSESGNDEELRENFAHESSNVHSLTDEFHKTVEGLKSLCHVDGTAGESVGPTPWSPTISLLDLAFKLKVAETRVFGLDCGIGFRATESESDNETDVSSDLAEGQFLSANENMAVGRVTVASGLNSGEQTNEVKQLFGDIQIKHDFSSVDSVFEQSRFVDSSPYQNSSGDALLKRFHCAWCQYRTDSKSHLLRHQKSIHRSSLPSETPSPLLALNAGEAADKRSNRSLRRHKCDQCSYQTDSKSHLRRHQGSVHSKKKPYRCHLCRKEFSRSEKAKDHFMNMHSEETYDSRRMRKFQPSTKDKGQSPVDTITKIKMLYEDLDPPVISDGSKKDEVKIECIDGDDDENSLNVLLEKSKALKTGSFGNKPYTCLKCDYASRDIWHLKRHISDVHLMRKDYKCKICHYATNRQHRFICHMRTHGEIFCFYCDYSNAKLDVFKQHLQLCSALHKMSTEVRCRLCELDCNDPDALKEHVTTLHGVVLYSCDSCSYYSEIYEDFENHSRIHEEEDRTCKLCNIVFETKQDEHLHCNAIHIAMDENKTLVCQICQHQEVNRSTMFNHVHQHTPQLYFCHVHECPFRATIGRSLALHTKYYHDTSRSESDGAKDAQTTMTTTQVSSAPHKATSKESSATKSTALGTYACPICCERPPFRYRKSFEKHMAQHAVEAESCPLCHDSFFLHKELQEHAFSVHGVRVV